jgi:hypothetical protein
MTLASADQSMTFASIGAAAEGDKLTFLDIRNQDQNQD